LAGDAFMSSCCGCSSLACAISKHASPASIAPLEGMKRSGLAEAEAAVDWQPSIGRLRRLASAVGWSGDEKEGSMERGTIGLRVRGLVPCIVNFSLACDVFF